MPQAGRSGRHADIDLSCHELHGCIYLILPVSSQGAERRDPEQV